MKKQTILISLILLVFSSIFGQSDYTPFNFEKGKWAYFTTCNVNNDYTYIFDTIFTNGDTIIKNQQYYKLYKKRKSSPNSFGYNSSLSYQCAINNNNNKQVVMIKPHDTIERILYDFNVYNGDSININMIDSIGDTVLVKVKLDTIVNSKPYCQKTLKQYNFQFPPNTPAMQGMDNSLHSSFWEGIGCGINFFTQNGNTPSFVEYGCNTQLKNYCEKGNTNCPCDSTTVGIQNIIKQQVIIEIKYDASTQQLQLTANTAIKDVVLYNTNGQKEQTWSGRNNTTFTFPVIGLAKGLYLVQCITANGEVKTEKIVIN